MNGKRIALIGHFGGNENILDGQTIKTKILYTELKNATDWDIKTVDTYYKRKNPVGLLIKSLLTMIRTKDIIVLLSGNGMKFYFPLLCFFAKYLKKRVYHDVIGGNLDTYIQKYPRFRKYLNSFKVNWVETENLKSKLINCGVNNCEVMPNFKRLNVTSVEEKDYIEPYCFCIFSRVMKEKGVETAMNAVQSINKEAGRDICRLDIFGRIDDGYKETFAQLIANAPEYIQYKGMVPYDESVEAIKGYYALLFPTFWSGEGFPGTIVDAFSAGIPVIATNWNCNGEIIENGKNGILYPNNEIHDLNEAIKWIINNKTEMKKMKLNCVEVARRYQPEKHIQTIVEEIQDAKKK